ncbi:UDP-D-apiose/UDP-D-xylose synthase [Ananas comosus]|uniref:UDP-D-apiose/UDP-D-xylose synthase n=1 Tax=Ananas comosus TaxID=4615 RepID=A0A199VMA5_ANACO|nr:UDP-D-apiose/UDP-D-xylose synthase [Ananas comosus]
MAQRPLSRSRPTPSPSRLLDCVALRSSAKEMEIDWPPMDGGPSCGRATAVPTTARMVREGAHGALWEDGQGEPAVRGGGGLMSCPLRRGGGLSRRLHVHGGRCHPPHLPPPGARRRRLRKIKNLLGPPPEHGRIQFHQFHRLNIKNDSRLEGLIKMSDLVSRELLAFLLLLLSLSLSHLLPGRQVTPWSLFSPLSPDVYSDKIKHLLEPPPEHGGIQFHRLNIKNDYRLEGHQDMINPTTICIPAYYNTRPLGTIYSNFMDALPVVKYCSENNKRLIHLRGVWECYWELSPRGSLSATGKHTANIFYYLLVVETFSMHSLWESSQVINDLAKVWVDA